MALFGFAQPKKEAVPIEKDAVIFDVTTIQFEEAVLKASMVKPVLVDFWAPWCGPCKQLMPTLEAEVNAAGGEVLLAKVNIDENPELAQAMQVQSVPTVLAFFQGQPVTGFTGARPASDIKNLIAQLVKLARSAQPDALDIPAALKEAGDLNAAQDYQGAQDIYLHILAQDPNNAEAYAGIVRVMIAVGAVNEAADMLEQAPELVQKSPAIAAVRTALDLARQAENMKGALGGLMQKVAVDPTDQQARFDLAQAQFAADAKGEAIDTLVESIRLDRNWNDEAARKELLRFFEALGFSDPLAVAGRKKLSSLLFS